MPTVIARKITERCAVTLLDETGIRWAPTELLNYLSAGQREIALVKPSAFTKNVSQLLIPGTRQEIPEDGVQFVELVRAMGTDGVTPGRALREVSRNTLDALDPDWHSSTADAQPEGYLWDDRDPRHYYVFPPQPDPAAHVELIYAATPADLETLDDVISLDDAYEPALYYFVLFRAFSKDSGTADTGKGMAFYDLFRGLISGREAAKQAFHPEKMAERAER